jgi:pimeloyl-ACP methyl ester carboxylesterase
MSPPVVLVHGGLGEDMDAERFWHRPGIVSGLRAAGFDVVAPDRDTRPASWVAAADALAQGLAVPSTVVGGSNGVSVAVRLAVDHRRLVDRLVLLWPATCGDPVVDASTPPEVSHLLAGDTLRGVTDDELSALDVTAVVAASEPSNRVHAEWTVERMVELMPRATRAPIGSPEPPHPSFGRVRGPFLAALTRYLR